METRKIKLWSRWLAVMISMAIIITGSSIPSIKVLAAETVTEGNFTYEISNGKAVLKSFNSNTATKVNIPAEINGYPVVEIGKEAFAGKTYIKELTIPESVLEIKETAFMRMTSLKEIVIPGSVTKIGMKAFYNCISLEKITLLYGIQSIGDGAFASCRKLSKVEIAPSVKALENNTFKNAGDMVLEAEPNSPAAAYEGDASVNVTHKKLPDDSSVVYKYSVSEDDTVSIDGYYGSSKNPVVPGTINGKSVEKIGNKVFKGTGIDSIKLPDSIKILGSHVFEGTNISELYLPAGVIDMGEHIVEDTMKKVISDSAYVEEYFSKYYPDIRFVPYETPLPSYHMLDIKTSGNGSVTLGESGYYKQGVEIDLVATPGKGYYFVGWTTTGNGTFKNTDSNSDMDAVKNPYVTYTMPTTKATVTASFAKSPRPEVIYKDGVFLEYNGSGDLNIDELHEKSDTDSTKVPTTKIAQNAFEHYVSEENRWYYGYPTTVTIPKTLQEIPYGVFQTCNTLKSIVVNEGNNTYITQDGVLFNKDITKLISYPRGNTAKNYTIPDTVTEIAPYAFYGSSNLEKITMPNEITTIGQRAFYGCYNLKEINFPSHLKEIGYDAFNGCRSLRDKLELPAGLETIGSNAFQGCSINEVTIPDSVTSIGSLAFYSCNSLQKFTVQSGNETYADRDGVLVNETEKCLIQYPRQKDLEIYQIPDDITSIAQYAFYYGSKLKEVKIPQSVTAIGSSAFSNCANLVTAVIPNGVEAIPYNAFSYCTSLERITLPENLKTISSYAFSSCTKLTDVTLPDTLTSIGSNAFSSCNSITKINIAKNVTSVASNAFYNSVKLEAITVDENNAKYVSEDGVLYTKNDTDKALVCYPIAHAAESGAYRVSADTKSIESEAFAHTKLKELYLPGSVASLKTNAFEYSNLEKLQIEFKDNYKGDPKLNVDNSPFGYILYGANTSNLVIYGYFDSTAEWLANNRGIRFQQLDEVTEGLVFDDNGTLIGMNNTTTKDVVIPSSIVNSQSKIVSVKAIGSNAFKNPEEPGSRHYEELTSIKLPLGVTTIENSAFDNCKALTSLPLPETLQKIGAYAFNDCSGLKKITIPAAVNNLDSSAFDGCTALEEIKAEGNSQYSDIDGVLINKDKKVIYKVPAKLNLDQTNGVYVVPVSITGIAPSAFAGCTTVKKVVLENVKVIEQNTFKSAFKDMESFVEVDLSNVLEIRSGAFEDCSSISSITIRKSLVALGLDVFIGCTGLTEINVDDANTKFASEDGVLYNKSKEALIFYPEGKVNDSFAIPANVNQIYDHAFMNNQNLRTVTMHDGIMMIGDSAFQNCNLETLVLPKRVEKIGDNAFAGNVSITSVNIPAHVSEIGTGAFIGCTSLATVKVFSKDVIYGSEGKVFDEAMTEGVPQLTVYAEADSTTAQYVNGKNIIFVELLSIEAGREKLNHLISDATILYEDGVEGTETGEFAPGSREILKAAIDAAQNVAGSEDADIIAVTDAITEIQTAIDVFCAGMVQYPVDKTELNVLLTVARTLHNDAVEGTEVGNYQAGAKEKINGCLNSASEVSENETAIQNQVDKALLELQLGILEFEQQKIMGETVSTSTLSANIIIAQAKEAAATEGIEVGQYSAGAKVAYAAAIDSAKAFLASVTNDTTQEAMEQALSDLREAGKIFAGAKKQPPHAINRADIMNEIFAAQALISAAVEGTEVGQYPVGMKNQFQRAIDAAIDILNERNPKQSDIDAKFTALIEAENEFRASVITGN